MLLFPSVLLSRTSYKSEHWANSNSVGYNLFHYVTKVDTLSQAWTRLYTKFFKPVVFNNNWITVHFHLLHCRVRSSDILNCVLIHWLQQGHHIRWQEYNFNTAVFTLKFALVGWPGQLSKINKAFCDSFCHLINLFTEIQNILGTTDLKILSSHKPSIEFCTKLGVLNGLGFLDLPINSNCSLHVPLAFEHSVKMIESYEIFWSRALVSPLWTKVFLVKI